MTALSLTGKCDTTATRAYAYSISLQTIDQWTAFFQPSSTMLGLMNAAAFLPSPM
jgi:hypothetical protein